MTAQKKPAGREAAEIEKWVSHVVREEDVDPRIIMANPKNIREHSNKQRQLFRELVAKVGFLGRIIVNDNTGLLIDGHMRVDEAVKTGQATVPVQFVSLTEEQEDIALMFFDQVGREAKIIKDKVKSLQLNIPKLGGMADIYLARLEKTGPINVSLLSPEENETGAEDYEDEDDGDYDDTGFSDTPQGDTRNVTLFLNEDYNEFMEAVSSLCAHYKTKNQTAAIVRAILWADRQLTGGGERP